MPEPAIVHFFGKRNRFGSILESKEDLEEVNNPNRTCNMKNEGLCKNCKRNDT